jgi:hypothetical protein
MQVMILKTLDMGRIRTQAVFRDEQLGPVALEL